MKSNKQILNDAADLLESVGWTQGAFAKHKFYPIRNLTDLAQFTPDCYCALGAIAVAGGYTPIDKDGYGPAVYLLDHIDERQTSTWNDREGQTAENVIATLRECAGKLP